MKIVIDITEDDYRKVQDGRASVAMMRNAIKNGTALPKEHGRLIDADVLVDGMEDDYEFCEAVNATPTIIKAERGEP